MTKSKIYLPLTFAIGLMVGLAYGFFAYRFHLPPYKLLLSQYLTIHEKVRPHELAVPFIFNDHVKVNSLQDVESNRLTLIDILWGRESLPVRKNIQRKEVDRSSRYKNIEAVESVEEILVQMEYGINSRMHLFHPVVGNGEMVLYHQGHAGDFINGHVTINALLGEGYAVLAASMPLLGLNSNPIVELPNLGQVELREHNQLRYLKPEYGSSLKYFIEPLIVAINYLSDVEQYKGFHAVGLSGGGWTITLLSALDVRIMKSFSVAGTEPISLAKSFPSEYELGASELYSQVNYLTLYVLSAVGLSRKHVQIHNAYDPCCYRGSRISLYSMPLAVRVSEIGHGAFQTLIDDTHTNHAISEFAMNFILDELK